MARGGLCLLLLSMCVLVFGDDDCVTYSFEEDFETMFNPETSQCVGMSNSWTLHTYTSAGVEPPNDMSKTFISPEVSADISCVTSFNFYIATGGAIEVNVFTENASTDQIIVIAHATSGGNLGSVFHSPAVAGFVDGWTTLRIPLTLPSNVNDGYIVLMGGASAESVVLVDSFRYVPPLFNEEDCIIYEDINPTTPPSITVTKPDDIDEINTTVIETTTEAIEDEEEDTATNSPTTDQTVDQTFWNTFTIAMIASISIIMLFLLCITFYELGKIRAQNKASPIILQEIDYNALPKPLTVPRVTKVYPDNNLPYKNASNSSV